MQHLFSLIAGLTIGLFSLIVAAIAMVEHSARMILMRIGIVGEAQTALLALLLLGLIVAAFRVFGRLFGVLIAVLLVLVLLHALVAPVLSGSVSI